MMLQNKIPVVMHALAAASPRDTACTYLFDVPLCSTTGGRVYIVDLDAAQCDSVTYRHPLSRPSVYLLQRRRMMKKNGKWREVATPLLFRESLYSNYFQPTGDSSPFMRQLTNQRTNLVGAGKIELARYSLEVEDLDHNRKKRKEKTGGKIIRWNDETFSIPRRGGLSSEKRETGNVSRSMKEDVGLVMKKRRRAANAH